MEIRADQLPTGTRWLQLQISVSSAAIPHGSTYYSWIEQQFVVDTGSGSPGFIDPMPFSASMSTAHGGYRVIARTLSIWLLAAIARPALSRDEEMVKPATRLQDVSENGSAGYIVGHPPVAVTKRSVELAYDLLKSLGYKIAEPDRRASGS
jgi:hypothetical protein